MGIIWIIVCWVERCVWRSAENVICTKQSVKTEMYETMYEKMYYDLRAMSDDVSYPLSSTSRRQHRAWSDDGAFGSHL